MFCFSTSVALTNVCGDILTHLWPRKVSSDEFQCFSYALVSYHFLVMSIPNNVDSLLFVELYFDVCQHGDRRFLVY